MGVALLNHFLEICELFVGDLFSVAGIGSHEEKLDAVGCPSGLDATPSFASLQNELHPLAGELHDAEGEQPATSCSRHQTINLFVILEERWRE